MLLHFNSLLSFTRNLQLLIITKSELYCRMFFLTWTYWDPKVIHTTEQCIRLVINYLWKTDEENSTLQVYFLQQPIICSQPTIMQWKVSSHSKPGLAEESCKTEPSSHLSSLVSFYLFFLFPPSPLPPPPNLYVKISELYTTRTKIRTFQN